MNNETDHQGGSPVTILLWQVHDFMNPENWSPHAACRNSHFQALGTLLHTANTSLHQPSPGSRARKPTSLKEATATKPRCLTTTCLFLTDSTVLSWLGHPVGQYTLFLAEAAFNDFHETPQMILSCLHLS